MFPSPYQTSVSRREFNSSLESGVAEIVDFTNLSIGIFFADIDPIEIMEDIDLPTSVDRIMSFDHLDNVDHEDFVIYSQEEFTLEAFQIMEELRHDGKLCDVTLKVRKGKHFTSIFIIT